eukprot:8098934-Pyramimonas_sp.AAC.1
MSEHPKQTGSLRWPDKPGRHDSGITTHFVPQLARPASTRALQSLDLPDKLDRSSTSDRSLGAPGPPPSAPLSRGGRARPR